MNPNSIVFTSINMKGNSLPLKRIKTFEYLQKYVKQYSRMILRNGKTNSKTFFFRITEQILADLDRTKKVDLFRKIYENLGRISLVQVKIEEVDFV